ncbi:MAG: type II toxin-antitoxin system PemK/MazF family toxin [Alphaproteobacteria bacterium]|jgi:mRNA interferase MazF|nr:type II toxin-antitoxin system PemK/MazF family toxin [Alphaproteobacteria bacterium]
MAAAYQPERGHFVHLDFTPHAGTEQAGRRPALVISLQTYNIATGLMLACPITNQLKRSPFEVQIPPGAKISGAVLANQMRSLDWLARNTGFHSEAPRDLVLQVIAIVEAIIIDPE